MKFRMHRMNFACGDYIKSQVEQEGQDSIWDRSWGVGLYDFERTFDRSGRHENQIFRKFVEDCLNRTAEGIRQQTREYMGVSILENVPESDWDNYLHLLNFGAIEPIHEIGLSVRLEM